MKFVCGKTISATCGNFRPRPWPLPYGKNLLMGMSLVELVLAMAMSALLILALVSMAMAVRNSFRLQESLAELQENSRYFADLLAINFSDSGFHPQPWLHESTPIGLMPQSIDASSSNSDRLVSRSWSDRNCFGSINPVLDPNGKPEFHLRESALELINGSLAHTCGYGPAADSQVIQINRQGLIPQVEAFQALYASDLDSDGLIDRWVKAGDWPDNRDLLAVRLGILSSSREIITVPQTRSFDILDFHFEAPADGRLRRVTSYTLPLRPLLP